MRIGDKKKPFYRVVIVDERKKRTGGYLELIGTYNPLTQPKDIKIKKDRLEYWLAKGAQKSNGFLRILGEAPKRPVRPSKKAKKEAPVNSQQPVEKEVKTEEKPVEEPKAEIPQEAAIEQPTAETATPTEEIVTAQPAPEVTDAEAEPTPAESAENKEVA